MPKIEIIDAKGTRNNIEALVGKTLMENAVKNSIIGIHAYCAGICSCTSCHVYIDVAFEKVIGIPRKKELRLLNQLKNTRSNSRLSCQIKITEEFEGLSFEVAIYS